jgi:hypothetical protein
MAVSNNGEVKWSPQANLESYCRLDLRDWPWDSHTCNIKLGLFSNQASINISQHRVLVSVRNILLNCYLFSLWTTVEVRAA